MTRAAIPQPLAIALWLAFLGWATLGADLHGCITLAQQRLVLIATIVLATLVVAMLAGRVRAPRLGWLDALVHLAPLALLVVVGVKVLDSRSLATAGEFVPEERPRAAPIAAPAPVTAPGAAPPATAAPASVYRPTNLLLLRYDPLLAGGPVELIGRIGRVPVSGRRKGQPVVMRTVLYRHLITCCAADGLPIYADLAEVPADAPLDVWMRLRGSADVRTASGATPVITVHSWEAVPQPEEPYLYREPDPLPEEFDVPHVPGGKPPGLP